MLDAYVARLAELRYLEATVTERLTLVTHELLELRDNGTITQSDVNNVFWDAWNTGDRLLQQHAYTPSMN